jgi:hypothetical protein
VDQSARRDPVEGRLGTSRGESVRRVDRHSEEHGVGAVEELPSVRSPSRLLALWDRDLPASLPFWKRPHVYAGLAALVRDVCEPLAVRGQRNLSLFVHTLSIPDDVNWEEVRLYLELLCPWKQHSSHLFPRGTLESAEDHLSRALSC